MKRLRLTLLLLLGSCAMASSEGESDTDYPADASVSNGFLDASPMVDAAPIPDATPPAVDAAPLSTTPDAAAGLFCDNSSQCSEANTCCFSLGGPGFCVSGTEVFDVCIPE